MNSLLTAQFQTSAEGSLLLTELRFFPLLYLFTIGYKRDVL